MKKITAVMCTYGRFRYVRRSIAMFLNQDYVNKHLLVYNNAPFPLEMDEMENVTIINNYIDLVTKVEYQDVGSIFRDAFTFIEDDVDYVSIWDDDDIFLEDHLTSGVNYLNGDPALVAWRRRYYFYKCGEETIEIEDGNSYTEGACILKKEFLDKIGVQIGTSLTYHHKWYFEAERNGTFGVDESPFPTFCVEAGQETISHISGLSSYNDAGTRDDVKIHSTDFGKGTTLVPWTKESIRAYLDIYFSAFHED